jgi:hypothetical protein
VGVNPSGINRIILAQFGENCIMQRKVYHWMERFYSVTTSIVEDCSSCLITSQIADNIEKVNGLVQEDRDRLLSVI